MAGYKFICRSCSFECVGSIGREVGYHSSKVTMICKSCSTIGAYTVDHQGGIDTNISKLPACFTCHSSSQLSEWNGLTCPRCNKTMRALGGDIDSEQMRFKYRQ